MSISKAGLYIKKKHYGGIKGGIHNSVFFVKNHGLRLLTKCVFKGGVL